MKSSTLQSLIRRNSAQITEVESSIKFWTVYLYHIRKEPDYYADAGEFHKKRLQKFRSKLKALVEIQCELKKILADRVEWRRYYEQG